MDPDRSKPIHNFSILGLKWGNQRVMRCAKVSTPITNHSHQKSLSAFNEQQQAYDRSQGFQKVMADLEVSTNKLKVSSFEEERPIMPWSLRIERFPYNRKCHTKLSNSAVGIVKPRNKKGEEEISEVDQYFLAIVGSKSSKKPKLWPKSMHWLLDVSNNSMTTPTTVPSQQRSLSTCNKQQQQQKSYEESQGYQKLMTDLKVSTGKLKLSAFDEGKPTRALNLRIEREPYNWKRHHKAVNSAVGIMLSGNKKEVEEEKINQRLKIIERHLKVSTNKLKGSIFDKGKPTRPWNLRIERAPWNCKCHTKPAKSIIGITVPANKKDEEEEKFSERLKFSISLSKEELKQDFLAMVRNEPPKKSNKCS